MLAKDILTEARYILSDVAKDRWSDARLLMLLNNGILDIAKKTTIFVETKYYVVVNNVVDIDLSTSVTKFLRAEYLGEPLPFYSFEEMDRKYGSKWQSDTGTEVIALVYDKQRNGLLKQYPIVENAITDNISYNSPYGIITDISYSDIEPTTIELYGDLGDIPELALIKFYYVRRHAKITDINTELEIDDLVAQPLQHYIAGMALRDNQDTQNRTMGAEELNLYSAMLEDYSMEKAETFVRTVHEVRYNPND